MQIENEKCREEEMKYIENGIIRIKVKYNLESHSEFLQNVVSIKEICVNKVLIQLCGNLPKCLHCSQLGHLSSNCELKKILFKMCKKWTSECNLAKSLFSNINSNVDIQ